MHMPCNQILVIYFKSFYSKIYNIVQKDGQPVIVYSIYKYMR